MTIRDPKATQFQLYWSAGLHVSLKVLVIAFYTVFISNLIFTFFSFLLPHKTKTKKNNSLQTHPYSTQKMRIRTRTASEIIVNHFHLLQWKSRI